MFRRDFLKYQAKQHIQKFTETAVRNRFPDGETAQG